MIMVFKPTRERNPSAKSYGKTTSSSSKNSNKEVMNVSVVDKDGKVEQVVQSAVGGSSTQKEGAPGQTTGSYGSTQIYKSGRKTSVNQSRAESIQALQANNPVSFSRDIQTGQTYVTNYKGVPEAIPASQIPRSVNRDLNKQVTEAKKTNELDNADILPDNSADSTSFYKEVVGFPSKLGDATKVAITGISSVYAGVGFSKENNYPLGGFARGTLKSMAIGTSSLISVLYEHAVVPISSFVGQTIRFTADKNILGKPLSFAGVELPGTKKATNVIQKQIEKIDFDVLGYNVNPTRGFKAVEKMTRPPKTTTELLTSEGAKATGGLAVVGLGFALSPVITTSILVGTSVYEFAQKPSAQSLVMIPFARYGPELFFKPLRFASDTFTSIGSRFIPRKTLQSPELAQASPSSKDIYGRVQDVTKDVSERGVSEVAKVKNNPYLQTALNIKEVPKTLVKNKVEVSGRDFIPYKGAEYNLKESGFKIKSKAVEIKDTTNTKIQNVVSNIKRPVALKKVEAPNIFESGTSKSKTFESRNSQFLNVISKTNELISQTKYKVSSYAFSGKGILSEGVAKVKEPFSDFSRGVKRTTNIIGEGVSAKAGQVKEFFAPEQLTYGGTRLNVKEGLFKIKDTATAKAGQVKEFFAPEFPSVTGVRYKAKSLTFSGKGILSEGVAKVKEPFSDFSRGVKRTTNIIGEGVSAKAGQVKEFFAPEQLTYGGTRLNVKEGLFKIKDTATAKAGQVKEFFAPEFPSVTGVRYKAKSLTFSGKGILSEGVAKVKEPFSDFSRGVKRTTNIIGEGVATQIDKLPVSFQKNTFEITNPMFTKQAELLEMSGGFHTTTSALPKELKVSSASERPASQRSEQDVLYLGLELVDVYGREMPKGALPTKGLDLLPKFTTPSSNIILSQTAVNKHIPTEFKEINQFYISEGLTKYLKTKNGKNEPEITVEPGSVALGKEYLGFTLSRIGTKINLYKYKLSEPTPKTPQKNIFTPEQLKVKLLKEEQNLQSSLAGGGPYSLELVRPVKVSSSVSSPSTNSIYLDSSSKSSSGSSSLASSSLASSSSLSSLSSSSSSSGSSSLASSSLASSSSLSSLSSSSSSSGSSSLASLSFSGSSISGPPSIPRTPSSSLFTSTKDSKSKKKKREQYYVISREFGKEVKLNVKGLSLREAEVLGQKSTSGSLSASYKVVKENIPLPVAKRLKYKSGGVVDKSRFREAKSIKLKGWKVEKAKYRLSAPGEKLEIKQSKTRRSIF